MAVTLPTALTAEEAALERDPTFRQEAVENIYAAAKEAGVPIDAFTQSLLKRYVEGLISCQELERRAGKPLLH